MQVAMQPPPYASYGPGIPPVATPVPAIVASVIPQHEVGFTQRQKKAMTILSGLQIAIGISCAIIYAVLISIQRKANGYYYIGYFDVVGAGIWCGGLYIIAGSLGVAAARQNRLSLMISSMVFSILSSLILWVVIGFAATAIDTASWDKRNPCYSSTPSYFDYQYDYPCVNYDYSGYQTADSILIILSVIELVISIWCSVLCCKGSCKACCLGCCYGSNYGYQPQMVYAPGNSAGQHVMYVQQNGVASVQAMNILPNQPFYVDMQRPVNFAHPTAAAPPGYQPGVTWLPGYPAAQLGNVQAGDADCGQRGEATKDELAFGH